ncbi:D-serine dehydratase [Geomicrobium sp. JCM 19037]|nr:D-serine dehydratase [Geomicrobium sp. JCM 19037]
MHGFMMEPTASPSMLLGLVTGLHDSASVYNTGLTNQTIADGLAVATPSRFVGQRIEPFLSGCMTVRDETLIQLQKKMFSKQNIYLEPSAAIGLAGRDLLEHTEAGKRYIEMNFTETAWKQTTHLVWSTGGSMVPMSEREGMLMSNFYEEVYVLTKQIPPGSVATYGLIARWLGNPRGARAVGWALQRTPHGARIPAHRVVRRDGTLAADHVFGGSDIQKELLENEGVPFSGNDRIDMNKAVWSGPVTDCFDA